MDTRYSHNDGVISLSQEEVMQRALLGTLPANVPAPPTGAIDRVSRSKIRYGISELVALNIDNVNRWLHTIADGEQDPVTGKWIVHPSPRGAIELFIELLQFSVPKMKAVQLDVKDKSGNMSRLSISDLQSIVADQ